MNDAAPGTDRAASGHPSQAEGEDEDVMLLQSPDGHAAGHPTQAEGDDPDAPTDGIG